MIQQDDPGGGWSWCRMMECCWRISLDGDWRPTDQWRQSTRPSSFLSTLWSTWWPLWICAFLYFCSRVFVYFVVVYLCISVVVHLSILIFVHAHDHLDQWPSFPWLSWQMEKQMIPFSFTGICEFSVYDSVLILVGWIPDKSWTSCLNNSKYSHNP